MPTATPFTALGSGNGFPFCLPKVNVADRGDGSPYDYWTTLSGWSKVSTPADDAAKAASIVESLQLAMKFFWNLYKVNVTTNTSSSDGSQDYSVSGVIVELEPNERTCLLYPFVVKEVDPEDRVLRVAIVSTRPSIVRLYNGITSDESNFVGYGAYTFDGTDAFRPIMTYADLGGRAKVSLGGYGDDEGLDNYYNYDYTYIEIDGLHFVCEARASNSGDTTGSASGLTATSTTVESSGFVGTSNARIDSLEFYTY